MHCTAVYLSFILFSSILLPLSSFAEQFDGVQQVRVRDISYVLLGLSVLVLSLILWNCMLRRRVSLNAATFQKTMEELRESEKRLRKSEEKFSLLFLSSPDSIVITKAGVGTFTDVNDRFLKYLGYAHEEVIGSTVIGLGIWAKPEERKVFRRLLAKDDVVNSFETTFKRKDGSIAHCLISGRNVEIQGEPHVISVVADISERKDMETALQVSEKRFRDISANAEEWVWETDSSGKYTYSNDYVERILGYTKDEILQMYFYDLFVPEEREALKSNAFEAFAQKQAFREFINKNIHKEGHIVWLSTNGIPIVDADGRLTGYRGADTDITARIWFEDERDKLLEQLRETLAKVKTLSGMLPICASCKKIKDDRGYWNRLEEYVRDHSEAEFSHGMCPDCEKKAYEELDRLKKMQ